jgi:antirestriction protein ArdC
MKKVGKMMVQTISEAVREAFEKGEDSFIFHGVMYQRKGKSFINPKKTSQTKKAVEKAPVHKEKSASLKKDYRSEITDNIIKLMEKGEAVWQKPWDSTVGAQLNIRPINAVTNRAYQGGNAVFLMAMGSIKDKGKDPRWCTFKQAKDKGWHIKKGEKSSCVEHWSFIDKDKDGNLLPDDEKKVKVFYHHVFHVSQIEGVPPFEPSKGYEGTSIELAEAALLKSKANIHHDQADRAFYRPSTDTIHLPPKEAFPKREKYYSVALHELSHWTGHESRLNRLDSDAFGSSGYAKEELRAELASLYKAAELGVPFYPEDHAAYTKSWISVLKDDKNEFFKAAKDAEKITEYVLDFVKEKIISQEKITEQEKSVVKIMAQDKKQEESLAMTL